MDLKIPVANCPLLRDEHLGCLVKDNCGTSPPLGIAADKRPGNDCVGACEYIYGDAIVAGSFIGGDIEWRRSPTMTVHEATKMTARKQRAIRNRNFTADDRPDCHDDRVPFFDLPTGTIVI